MAESLLWSFREKSGSMNVTKDEDAGEVIKLGPN